MSRTINFVIMNLRVTCSPILFTYRLIKPFLLKNCMVQKEPYLLVVEIHKVSEQIYIIYIVLQFESLMLLNCFPGNHFS